MNFTIADRQTGKTTKLLKLMSEDDGITMISATQELAALFERTFRHGWPNKPYKNRFVSISGLRDFRGRRARFVIDDLDSILYDLLHISGEIVHVTATGIIDPL